MSEGDDQDFKVQDRRRFDRDGSPRDTEAEATEPDTAAAQNAERVESDGAELPGIDFSTFILSLSTSAMIHLGEAPAPEGEVGKNLPMARQVIDIIGLLEEKTRGNLTAEEHRLIEDLLYDLRMRFVTASR